MSRISLSVVSGYTPTQKAARPESATSPYRYFPRSTPSTSENRRRSRLPLMSMTLLVRGNEPRIVEEPSNSPRISCGPVDPDFRLVTDRLILRPYRRDDLEDLHAMFS